MSEPLPLVTQAPTNIGSGGASSAGPSGGNRSAAGAMRAGLRGQDFAAQEAALSPVQAKRKGGVQLKQGAAKGGGPKDAHTAVDSATASVAFQEAVAAVYGGTFKASLDGLDKPGVVFSLSGAKWPIAGIETKELDTRGGLYSAIAAAYAPMRDAIVQSFGGSEGVAEIRRVLSQRAATVAGAPKDLEARFNRCVEADQEFALRDFKDARSLAAPGSALKQELDFVANPQAPDKAKYIERYMSTLREYGTQLGRYADSWRGDVEFYAHTVAEVGDQLTGVYLLALPGDPPVYVKPGEDAAFFVTHEATLGEFSGALRSEFDKSKNELEIQERLNGTFAGSIVQYFSGEFDRASLYAAENAVGAASMAALAQRTLAKGDPGARFAGIVDSYTTLSRAAEASELFAGAVTEWKAELMSTAQSLVGVCRTIRDAALAVLSSAAGGQLVPIFQGWGMARGAAVVLETAALQLATSTVTEFSEAGFNPAKVNYVKIGKDVGTASINKAMEPIGKALPDYARRFGYPEFANAYAKEASDEVMSALLEQSVADTLKVFEGKEISDEEFMKAVFEKVLVAAPKKYLGDKIEAAEIDATAGNAIKGSGEKVLEMGASRLTGNKSPGTLGDVAAAGVNGVAEGLPEQASDHESRKSPSADAGE